MRRLRPIPRSPTKAVDGTSSAAASSKPRQRACSAPLKRQTPPRSGPRPQGRSETNLPRRETPSPRRARVPPPRPGTIPRGRDPPRAWQRRRLRDSARNEQPACSGEGQRGSRRGLQWRRIPDRPEARRSPARACSGIAAGSAVRSQAWPGSSGLKSSWLRIGLDRVALEFQLGAAPAEDPRATWEICGRSRSRPGGGTRGFTTGWARYNGL